MSLSLPTVAQAATNPDSLADELSSMPDTITVTYEDYEADNGSTGENLSTKQSSKSLKKASAEDEEWKPFAYRWYLTEEEEKYVEEHSEEQTKNKASIATLSNHPELRKALESLFDEDELYGEEDDKYAVVGNMLYSRDSNLKNKVLAETATGEALRKKIAKLTSSTLGLEDNLPSSWAVPFYVYYNKLDNNRGLLPLPSSLNDNISKRNFINLMMSGDDEFDHTADEAWEAYASYDGNTSDDIDEYKDLEDMWKLGKDLAAVPTEGAALGAFFARAKTFGNYYGLEDANKKSLDSSMTRVEALYNLMDLGSFYGLTCGWTSYARANGPLSGKADSSGDRSDCYTSVDGLLGVDGDLQYDSNDEYKSRIEDEYEADKAGTLDFLFYKDFSLDELDINDVKAFRSVIIDGKGDWGEEHKAVHDAPLDGVFIDEMFTGAKAEDFIKDGLSYGRSKMGIIKKVINTKKVAVGKKKVTKKRKTTIDFLGTKIPAEVTLYKFQKKVKGKTKYKWAKSQPTGWKYVYKVKYKTVKETEDILRIGYCEPRYTVKNIEQLNKYFDMYFRDAKDIHIMTVDEIHEAYDKLDYFKVWATEGRTEALSRFNAYAMSKQWLTPEAATRIIKAYAVGLCLPDEEGNLNPFSNVTWNDALVWITMNETSYLMPNSGEIDLGIRWTGYKNLINAKYCGWDEEYSYNRQFEGWEDYKDLWVSFDDYCKRWDMGKYNPSYK